MSSWSKDDMGSMKGRIVVITGATSGIGFESAKQFAHKEATVIIAASDSEKGQRAIEEIKKTEKKAKVIFEHLNLASLSSVSSFADRIMQEYPVVDILINNAGISAVQKRMETLDGHELTFGVNYLGHFYLTTQLFPLLLRGTDPRIIFLSSIVHKRGRMHFDDLEFQKNYDASEAYAQSKLAMLLFSLELHHRCQEQGLHVKVIPVHPGASQTHIFDKGPQISGRYFHPVAVLKRIFLKTFGQNASKGALPILFAANSIEARSGIYYGPDGPFEIWGNPTEVGFSTQAANLIARERIWDHSERLTGINFNVASSKSIGLH